MPVRVQRRQEVAFRRDAVRHKAIDQHQRLLRTRFRLTTHFLSVRPVTAITAQLPSSRLRSGKRCFRSLRYHACFMLGHSSQHVKLERVSVWYVHSHELYLALHQSRDEVHVA